MQEPRRSATTLRCRPLGRVVQCAATPRNIPPLNDRGPQPVPSTKPAVVEPKVSVAAQLNNAWKHQWEHLMEEVMPDERGDAKDWALMYTSVAVFVFMAMQMFRVYAYWYYAAGLRPIMQTFH
ncbi:g3163 [Coccomyxa viridis]|uniref:G3163 protein n=1 Tax=Coccomyxa viridis TaxID=1274662 RepID=A0ABP1FR47_9CHLO